MQSSGKINSQDVLFTPDNSALILIDYQPQPLFGVQSQDRTLVINAVLGLAKAARAFEVPTILTTLSSRALNGPLFPELQEVFPDQEPIDRTCFNAFEDTDFLGALRETKRKKLLIAGIWSEVSLCFSARSALQDGYGVQVVADASGGTTTEAHQLALQQLTLAGALLWTWQQVVFGWQRDWERIETSDKVRRIFRQHGGAFGQGIVYAQAISRAEIGKNLSAPRRGLRPAGMER